MASGKERLTIGASSANRLGWGVRGSWQFGVGWDGAKRRPSHLAHRILRVKIGDRAERLALCNGLFDLANAGRRLHAVDDGDLLRPRVQGMLDSWSYVRAQWMGIVMASAHLALHRAYAELPHLLQKLHLCLQVRRGVGMGMVGARGGRQSRLPRA